MQIIKKGNFYTMRLGQVKRIYNIETSKIVSFLNKKGIEISNHPNSKLTDEQLNDVLDFFQPKKEEAPPKNVEVIEEKVKSTPIKKSKNTEYKDAPKVGEVIELQKVKTKKTIPIIEEEIPVDVEVIRAPKQKVEGLKIVGKIDLPQPKIDENNEESTAIESANIDNDSSKKENNAVVESDQYADLHPNKRAKLKAKAKLEEINTKVLNHDYKSVKKEKKEKSIAEKIAEQKKNKPKKKKANPHRHLKKSGIKAKRIEISDDGTILPRNEQEELNDKPKMSFLARIWKWFNT